MTSLGPEYGTFGTGDDLEFWSAFQFFELGANPYDRETLWTLQNEMGRLEEPILLWNPLWILTLLSPLLVLDFTTFYLAFFGLNIGVLACCGHLSRLWSLFHLVRFGWRFTFQG